jgi:hypothetical protein
MTAGVNNDPSIAYRAPQVRLSSAAGKSLAFRRRVSTQAAPQLVAANQ